MEQDQLIAIGGAYIDINAFNFPVDEHGIHLETEIVGQDYELELGGSAVNFARLCAALDVPTAFVGKVGKDALGDCLIDLLEKSQVQPALVTSKGVSTNVSFNMINASGKSIMTVAGTANQALTVDEVYLQASERIATSSYLYLGGSFKLKKLMPAFLHLAQDAKVAGTKIVLDHGRVHKGITEDEKEAVRQLVLMADIYLPSADEFMQLWDVSSIEEELKLLQQKTPHIITVVKNSDQGTLTLIDDKLIVTPAFPVKLIHTIGAGDSFNAGFIAAQHKGKELIKSVEFGCATAALKISQHELPTFDSVVQFIASHPTT
jgi:sugar/nucleoside kinase (ribokinase family)